MGRLWFDHLGWFLWHPRPHIFFLQPEKTGESILSSSIINEFINAMCAAGCEPANHADIQPTGEDTDFRIAGDKKIRGVYILTIEHDGFAHGNFRDFKTGNHGKWNSGKAVKGLSPEEHAANTARIKKLEADKQARREAGYAAAAIKAAETWALAKPCLEHAYLTAKGIEEHGTRVDGSDLIIPIYYDGAVVSYQRIKPDGEKRYLTGGRKQGGFFPMTDKTVPKDVILVAEGFSTAASVRQATGLPVVAAFDAGNLLPVAQDIRKKYPEAKIILCADNDAYGEKNTGHDAAKQAALKVGGFVALPEFKDKTDEPTDWNDSAALNGLDHVKNEILRVIDAAGAVNRMSEVSPPPSTHYPVDGDYFEDQSEPMPYEPEPPDPEKKDVKGDLHGLPFKVLGYNNGNYYYFPFGGKQIVSLTAGAHTINNLLLLAPLDKWVDKFGGADISHSRLALYAWNEMRATAERRGVFEEAESVRGSGAWLDAGRVILHCGDVIYADGIKKAPETFISGGYTYVASKNLLTPTNNPLSTSEAYKLREICESVTFDNKLSGSLLAGWLVIAPFCGLLRWRPHIWLVGQPGSGKSTVMDDIIKPVLGKFHLRMDGGSSEAGVREKMGYSARPLVVDEAEASVNSKITAMEGLVELARKASSGAVVGKFGQRPFKAQFMAVFSSVNPPVSHAADIGRISFLGITQNRKVTAQEDYNRLMQNIKSVITEDFSSRLLDRTLENLPALLNNINVFTVAARTVLKAARAADQIGPMLAGLYLLGSTKEISEKDAEAWIAKHDWTVHTNIAAESEPEKLLAIIFSAQIKITPKNGNGQNITIGELINIALRGSDNDFNITKKDADIALRQHSIIADRDGIFIGKKSDALEKLISRAGFIIGMGKWGRVLLDIQGVKTTDTKYFHAGNSQKATLIPLSMFDDGIKQSSLIDVGEIGV